MTEVEIEYCVPCDLLDNATRVQRHLLTAFGENLDRVALVTGDSGVFKIRLDGTLIFDGQEERYDPEAVLATVREHLQAREAHA